MRAWLTIYIFIWLIPARLNAQQPELILPVGHTDIVRSARFSHDGKFVITSGQDKQVMIWQTMSGKLIRNLQGSNEEIIDAFFSNDGRFIAAITDFSVYVWSVQANTLLGQYDNNTNALFSPDSKKLFIQNYRGVITQVGLPTMTRERVYDDNTTLPNGLNLKIRSIDISPDGMLLCVGYDSTLTIRDIGSGEITWKNKMPGLITTCFFAPGGQSLVVMTDAGAKKVDLRNHYTVSQFGNGQRVDIASLSNNKKFLMTCSGDFVLDISANLWETDTGKLITSFNDAFGADTVEVIDSNGNFISYKVQHGDYKVFFPGFELAASGSSSVADDGKHVRVMNVIWDNSDFLNSIRVNSTYFISHTEFSPDGRYALVQMEEGKILLWDIGANKAITSYQVRVDKIRLADIRPDGKKMLISGYGKTAKQIDITTGKTDFVLESDSNLLSSAMYSPDGNSILTNSNDSIARLWDANSGQLIKLLPGQYPDINPAYFIPTGKLVLPVAQFDTVPVYDMNLNIAEYRAVAHRISNREKISGRTSSTGKYWLDDQIDGRPHLYDTALNKGNDFIVYNGSISANAFSHNEKLLALSDDADDSLSVWDIENRRWLFSGRIGIIADSYKGSNGLSQLLFTPDDNYLLAVDQHNFVHVLSVKDFKPVTGFPGQRCAFSGNGEILLVVNRGVCDVYDFKKRELLYTYIAVNNTDYLTIDAHKRYDGTEEARKLLYYSCGNEIIDLAQFKELLWVPNLTERILKNDPVNAKTLEELNICGLTPEVEDKSHISGEYFFNITPRRGGLGETVLYVNGIEAKRYKPAELRKNDGSYELIIQKDELNSFFVPGKENPVTVKSYTADNTVSSRGAVITVSNTEKNLAIPDLYAVMVGISDYKGDELDLKYAAKDASDLSSMLGRSARKMLNTDGKEHVFIYDLTTAEKRYALPEKNSIKKALEEIGAKAKANDILFIFFAGHGVMEGEQKQFYFLTADASKASAASTIADVGISTAELTEWMKPQHIRAQKRILIFDACNSGQAIKDLVKIGKDDQGYIAARNDEKGQQVKAIEKLNEQSGLFILSASASNQSAYEMSRYSQGLLTYSLLKAIKEQPDILQDGKWLDVSRWFNAAEKTVSELTKDNGARQQPQIVSNTNFNIGLVDEEVMAKIILPAEKPLFTASIFLNNDEAVGDDDLELSKLTNRELAGISARDVNSQILYITATNSPDAYTLTGRYEVKGNAILVKVNLKQNKTIKNRFEIRGTKDKLEELAAAIASKASSMVK